ncbi:hypothetical protein ACHAXT_000728 [Thalassiosira profunda]
MGNDGSATLRQLACLLGASGVGLGAFGAHALKATLSQRPSGDANWKTAVTYQLLHAVAILSLSTIDKKELKAHPSSWSGGKTMALGTALSLNPAQDKPGPDVAAS